MNIKYMCDPRKILTLNKEQRYNFPISIEIQPTNLCNLSCEYCSYKERKLDGCSLSKEQFDLLIRTIIEMKIKAVYFSGGGEPTLYPYLGHAIKELHDNNIKVALITNGTQEELLYQIAGQCEYILVNVATNGDKTAQYNSKLLARKLKNNSNLKGCLIGARLIITKKNYTDVEKIVSSLINNEFDYVQCTPAVNYTGEELYIDESELDKVVQSKIFEHPSVMLSKKNTGNKSEVIKCRTLEMGVHAIITAEGKVNICPPLSRSGEIGNLNELPFLKIWNGDKHRTVIESINSNYNEETCKYCRFLSYNRVLEELERAKNNPHAVFI